LNDQDISQLLKTTEQFARRQPALFLAATFALGFAGTRFLKSSSPSASRMSQGDGYWQSQDRSDWQSSGSYGSSSGFGSGGAYGSSGSFDSSGGYGSSGSYGSGSTSSTGSGRTGSGSTTGGSYGSTAGSGDETRFAGSASSKSNSEWQSSTDLNSGPEGQ